MSACAHVHARRRADALTGKRAASCLTQGHPGRGLLGERPLLCGGKAKVPGLAYGRAEKEKGKVSPEMPQEEDGAQASPPAHSQSQETPSSSTRSWRKK